VMDQDVVGMIAFLKQLASYLNAPEIAAGE
jgi:hypothetical protein